MFKKYLPLIIISSLVILLPMLFGLIFWDKLPEQMPSHFGFSGEADGYTSRAAAVIGIPLALLAGHVLCVLITLIDPKRKNIGKKPLTLLFWIIPSVSLIVYAAVYAHALGYRFNVSLIVMAALGVLMIFLGNWLPKFGLNYTFGIRTAWALNDEDNWRATHRFGGKVFIALGILTVILAILSIKFAMVSFILMMIADVIACAATYVYSYVYYVRHGRKEE